MGSYGIPENPAFETSSRMKRWWLESFWGYETLEVRQRPMRNWMGTVALGETYLMLRRGLEIQ